MTGELMSEEEVFYRNFRRMMESTRIVHGAYTQSVLLEFKSASEAETVVQMLQQLKDEAKAEAKAERKAEMLARGAGG